MVNNMDYNIGDINYDGIINVLDVMIIVSYIFGENMSNQLMLCDLNYDFSIDILDIMYLIEIILIY